MTGGNYMLRKNRRGAGWFCETFFLVFLIFGSGAKRARAANSMPVAHPEISAADVTRNARKPTGEMTGKRDPFAVPQAPESGALNGPAEPLRAALPPGKKGLIIGQLRLEGIVRQNNGSIAVVTNRSNRAYFLKVHDQLYDGFVARITEHSIVFREVNRNGAGATGREIVRNLGSAAGDN